MDLQIYWYSIPIAFILDLAIGDPMFAHHPVRYMGKAIEYFEPRFRKLPFDLVFSGIFFAVFLISATWAIAAAILFISYCIHPWLKIFFEIIMIYFSISFNGLEKAAYEIYALLKLNKTEKAKYELSMIVGRDVENLDKGQIARACVETVAENLVDGVISPLFFAAMGGAPLIMAYKMINTLDSMTGYKNEKYMKFGKGPARIDDIANFIPARISIIIIAISAWILGKKGKQSFITAIKEGKNHKSPNAGYPEAAFAGALSIKLGGPNFYGKKLVVKPFIGEKFGDVSPDHIPKSCHLMVLSSFLWTVILVLTMIFS